MFSGSDLAYHAWGLLSMIGCAEILYAVLSSPAVAVLGAGSAGVASNIAPDLGQKLEFVFGNATGSLHNINRSLSMERVLNKIGIFDNYAGRQIVERTIIDSFYNSEGIVQSNGRVLREALLIGPNGIAKIQTIWEQAKLITIEVFG